MIKLQTFSLYEDDLKKLSKDAKHHHMSKSAFLRYLIWNYSNKNNVGEK
jgi:hypothetical protein